MTQWRSLRRLVFPAVLLMQQPAWASMQGTGSSRVPLTSFLVELYNVMSSVYAPWICLGVIILVASAIGFGYMRVGPGLGRILAVVGIISLGVTFVANIVGGNTAVALIIP